MIRAFASGRSFKKPPCLMSEPTLQTDSAPNIGASQSHALRLMSHFPRSAEDWTAWAAWAEVGRFFIGGDR